MTEKSERKGRYFTKSCAATAGTRGGNQIYSDYCVYTFDTFEGVLAKPQRRGNSSRKSAGGTELVAFEFEVETAAGETEFAGSA